MRGAFLWVGLDRPTQAALAGDGNGLHSCAVTRWALMSKSRPWNARGVFRHDDPECFSCILEQCVERGGRIEGNVTQWAT